MEPADGPADDQADDQVGSTEPTNPTEPTIPSGATEPTLGRTLLQRLDIRRWWMVSRVVVAETYHEWRQDRTLRLGAGLAYYGLFTIVPFLALVAALAREIFGIDGVQEYFADRIRQVGVTEATDAGEAIAAELGQRSAQTTLGLFGLGSLIFASSLVFLALVDAIHTIWHEPFRAGIRNSVRRRLIAFVMVFGTGAVIIGAFAVSAITSAADRFISVDLPLVDAVGAIVAALASGVSLAAALAVLFRYTSPTRTAWFASALAGGLTAVFMLIGTELTGWYLRTLGGSSLSGAFGAVILVLTWVYFEAQILLAGVQLVKVMTWRTARLNGVAHDPDAPD